MSHYADSKMESACLHQDVSTTLRGQRTISLRLIRLLCHVAAVVVGCGGEGVRLIQDWYAFSATRWWWTTNSSGPSLWRAFDDYERVMTGG